MSDDNKTAAVDDQAPDPGQMITPAPQPQAMAPAPQPQVYTGQEYGQTALICGIVGLFFAPVGIVALIYGMRARKEAAATGLPISSEANIGFILGLITTILMVIIVAVFILIFGAMILGWLAILLS